MRGQGFDGDRAVEAGIAGLGNFAHAPGAEGGFDSIGAEAGAGAEGQMSVVSIREELSTGRGFVLWRLEGDCGVWECFTSVS